MLDSLWYSLGFAIVSLVGLAVFVVSFGFMVSVFIFHIHRPR